MFTDQNLVSKQFTVDGNTFTEVAPIAARQKGVERLLSQRAFLNEMFRDNGGLDHHIDMFAAHINSIEGEIITIELQEISWLFEEGEFESLLSSCLADLAKKNSTAKTALLRLSTVIDGRRFLTLTDAKEGNYEDKDMWNYFRIMGESYIRNVPWS